MKKVTVKVSGKPAREYVIHISAGAIQTINTLYDFGGYTNVFIVTDDSVPDALLDQLTATLAIKTASIVLATGENHKNIESVQKIWQAMQKAGCDRKSAVINLGG